MKLIEAITAAVVLSVLISGCTAPPAEPGVEYTARVPVPEITGGEPSGFSEERTMPEPETAASSSESSGNMLTSDEARELVSELWNQYLTVRSWYINDGLPLDYEAEPEVSIYGVEYYPVTGDILSIAELTRATEKVITHELAQEFYDLAFDGEILLYCEAGGVLFGTAPPAVGFSEEWRFDTLVIKDQTEDSIAITAEQYIWTTEETFVKEIVLEKSAEGWRIQKIDD